ncbi:MAG TPA: DUF2357 domain-containing protein [Rubricoccaceae bacterium]|nr:DUF2357 domain-containing protein [Rubricoccaceae bacterium]
MADLFTITTDRVRLSWSGPALAATEADGLVVEPVAGPAEVRLGDGAVHAVDNRWTAPLRLVEEVAYPVLLRSRTGEPVALHHRDPVVVGGLTAAEGGRVRHGAVRFGAFVGTSRFVVLVGGRPEVVFSVAVAPRKVGEEDAAAMRREVEAALAGLAVRYLGATTVTAFEVPGPPPRPVWLVHLRAALPALEAALAAVARHPREALRRAPGFARTERVTRPDAAVLRAVMRGGSARAGWPPVPERLSVQALRRSLDTPEHRWLRTRLEAAAHRLALARREEARLPASARRARVRAELDDAALRLRRLLALPPLAEASGTLPPTLPLALHAVPGYAEARAALRRLDTGLALAEGGHEAVPRDLAGLYEVWSYLAVARTLAEVLGQPLPTGPFFGVTAEGVRLRLRRGRRHALRLRAPGVTVRLAYEPRFPVAPGLLAQRPDFLLTVERPGTPPRLYVLDAKYRRDDSAAYRRRHGAPGPPEDALGDLHRYRDAIVRAGPAGVERPVETAVALFPYREPEPGAFGRSRLWASIAEIGVGAIPLLPGAAGYLARWLEGVIIR